MFVREFYPGKMTTIRDEFNKIKFLKFDSHSISLEYFLCLC